MSSSRSSQIKYKLSTKSNQVQIKYKFKSNTSISTISTSISTMSTSITSITTKSKVINTFPQIFLSNAPIYQHGIGSTWFAHRLFRMSQRALPSSKWLHGSLSSEIPLGYRSQAQAKSFSEPLIAPFTPTEWPRSGLLQLMGPRPLIHQIPWSRYLLRR